MKQYAGAILTDLSKTLDSLNRDLLIPKFRAYGFDEVSIVPSRRPRDAEDTNISVKIGKFIVKEKNEVKLLGVLIES